MYIDVWQNRSDVLSAINYGLQEAIDDLDVPNSTVAKGLKTPVKKVAAGPVSLDFGDEPIVERGVSMSITVSCGVATFEPGSEESSDTLISRADAALYEAKSNGGNQTHWRPS